MPSHPDAELFPHATSDAAKTVEEHSSEEELKLYSGWFCPFVQRVWLTLEELQIPYQYIEVNPYNKPDSLLSLNPRGLVPTLSVPTSTGTSKPLYESNIVAEYLNETHVERTRPAGERKGSWEGLFPKDKYRKAYGKIWIDHVTSRIIPAFHRFLQHDAQSKTDIDVVRQEFLTQLKSWIEAAEPLDNEDGPFFFGSQFSLVDIALAPWAVRLWVFDHFKSGGLGLPSRDSTEGKTAAWKRWYTWLDAVEARESIVKTTSEKEKYVPIYQRYADNTAQSELAKATREGRGVP